MGAQIKACFYDMDDTLVRTGAADVKAYKDVMRLAADVREQVQSIPIRTVVQAYTCMAECAHCTNSVPFHQPCAPTI